MSTGWRRERDPGNLNPSRLAKTLTNTNCIESMISVARTVMRNVKWRKDGPMRKRWVATGMLEAERSFPRVKGCKEMPLFVAALRRNVGVSEARSAMRKQREKPGITAGLQQRPGHPRTRRRRR
jgi:hypothetical protein